MNQYIDFTSEPIVNERFYGSIAKIYPTGEKDKFVFIAHEGEYVGVYATLKSAALKTDKLATITKMEWDEHDRAGEYGACSLCDDTHMIMETTTDWRVTLREVIQEQYKQHKMKEA